MPRRDSSAPLLSQPLDVHDVVNPTRTFTYILLVTIIVGGLQLSWSTEFSNGTPYLLSLGMSKTMMSLVWIAGPLSGTLGQPIVGVISDESRWKYGRRRPLIIFGALATITSLLVLSWSKDIVYWFSFDKHSLSEDQLRQRTIPFAALFVYVLDFSISVIQAASRAYIVDNVPTHQQNDANAWAARMTGIGNIFGYVLGSMNLVKAFPWLGNTQFKVLSAWACIALVVTVTPAVIYVTERDPNTDPTIVSPPQRAENIGKSKIRQIYNDTYHAIVRLSPQTRLLCNVQFFAWIGYFPMLFYTTTYVGDIYRREILASRPTDAPPLTQHELDELWEEGTRKGAYALVIYSITSLIANFVLPYMVSDKYYKTHRVTGDIDEDEDDADSTIHTTTQFKLRRRFENFVDKYRTSVAKMWTASHILFAITMFSTFWVKTTSQATALVGVLGVCWAVAHWAPFTIISEEISRVKEKKARAQVLGTENDGHKYHNYEHEAGIVLGVHNVFVAAPQMISSLMSSILFLFFDADGSGDSIGWVFRFGGVFTLVAIYLSLFIKEPHVLDTEDELDY
ncbi:Sucrose transport protein SUC5 [Sugiyamaella lignohabitans]|uniref:Sucrose transport protein SUC5 n=1 Tax=Sugiyamaella lignohabitans TaxID=796027 RepID=A0A161HKP3_9ASCO|nr:Sucrose transport protein SUC5 [Sugiyamaella lignohabitans]ANB13637.1 Sucrose transport protein SUC5 [Sugiyamaella lignohabitans]